jgi:hypothetical protein
LQFWRRTGEWIWHGFRSAFGLVSTEVGTEGTGSKIDLKKRAEFLQNPGKFADSEDQMERLKELMAQRNRSGGRFNGSTGGKSDESRPGLRERSRPSARGMERKRLRVEG